MMITRVSIPLISGSGALLALADESFFSSIKELGMAVVVAWVLWFTLTRLEAVLKAQTEALERLSSIVIAHDKLMREKHGEEQEALLRSLETIHCPMAPTVREAVKGGSRPPGSMAINSAP
jgi:hypothetical protein